MNAAMMEFREAPAAVLRQAETLAAPLRQLVSRLRQAPPKLLMTCARGSSANAAVFCKYLVERHLGGNRLNSFRGVGRTSGCVALGHMIGVAPNTAACRLTGCPGAGEKQPDAAEVSRTQELFQPRPVVGISS